MTAIMGRDISGQILRVKWVVISGPPQRSSWPLSPPACFVPMPAARHLTLQATSSPVTILLASGLERICFSCRRVPVLCCGHHTATCGR